MIDYNVGIDPGRKYCVGLHRVNRQTDEYEHVKIHSKTYHHKAGKNDDVGIDPGRKKFMGSHRHNRQTEEFENVRIPARAYYCAWCS